MVALEVHAETPGRVRFSVPGLRWNDLLGRRLEERLLGRRGVLDAHAAPSTGRILVHFEPELTKTGTLAETIRALVPEPPPKVRHERVDWHAFTVEETLAKLGSDRRGLTSEEAHERLARYGPNQVTDVKARSTLRLFGDQIASRPALLLLGAATVSFAIGDVLEGVALSLAIGTNLTIGFVTERRAEELIRGYKGSRPRLARVRRAGSEVEVPAANVVPGDLLLLRANDFVVADARVLEAHDLQLDESALTGESLPVTKDPAPRKRHKPLAERSDMVHRGTLVVSGHGEAAVTATGGASEMGRIARLVREAEPPETPLEEELDDLSRRIELLGLGATAAIALVGLVRGRPLGRVVRSAIALGVAAIPEGLPATATTALALSMRRLRTKGIVIRRLAAAETLGSTNVICADKTGTLTLNQMQVDELWAPSSEARRYLVLVLALSNDVRAKDGKLVGSPTERALVERAARALAPVESVESLVARYPKLASRPRRPGAARAITVHRSRDGLIALAKGSPDAIREILADPRAGYELERRNARLADEGKRVLGAAWRHLPEPFVEEDLARGFELAGLAALADPIRPDACATLERARRAGIRCVILTGDQVETARAVARTCGLAQGGVIEAADLERLDRRGWERLAVVARASPEDKLAVVRALQDLGNVVAMAGDGVNDAVALRAADVGIALPSRTQALPVALADVILATESMAGIIDAIAEGRALRDNIRRAAMYLIATNASELALVLAASLLGIDDPLTPLQLLWINLLGDTAPALALALEPVEPDVLERPPARPGERLVARSARRRLAFEAAVLAGSGLGAYAVTALRGAGRARARSTASAAVMAGQLLHALGHRAHPERLPSPRLAGATGAGLAIEAATLFVPGLRQATGTVPLRPLDLLVAACGAIAPQAVFRFTNRKGRTA
jgi:Ca2+-transporting ATPase